MGLFRKLVGTSDLQEAIDRHVMQMGLPKLDEERNRILALAVGCVSMARFDADAMFEPLQRGPYRATASELIEQYKLRPLIEERQARGAFPFDKVTTQQLVSANLDEHQEAAESGFFCTACGDQHASETDRFCRGCGAPSSGVAEAEPTNTCPKCQAPLGPNPINFCAKCGNALGPVSAEPGAARAAGRSPTLPMPHLCGSGDGRRRTMPEL
nr:hypothetical protein [uncultured bacterium]